jgi:hypothetical protein
VRDSAQESHQDSAYVTYTLPLKFAASWVALEDVSIGAGELSMATTGTAAPGTGQHARPARPEVRSVRVYYPGSHRLPDFRYSGRYKSLSEAEQPLFRATAA